MSDKQQRIEELSAKTALTNEEMQELMLLKGTFVVDPPLSAAEVLSPAIHWWMADRHNQGVDVNAKTILQMLFSVLDALHFSLRQVPELWTEQVHLGYQMGGINSIILQIPLSPAELTALRACLSLTGDANSILRTLDRMTLLELDKPIAELLQQTEHFRPLRNFFTHMDERLSDLDRHGIRGNAQIPCGIHYTQTAQGCFHLVLSGNILFFTQYGQGEEMDVGKDSFRRIFEKAKVIYSELVSHKIHARQYPPYIYVYP